jgi:YHS domain-containing protein
MKTRFLIIVLVAASALLAFGGCERAEQADAQTTPGDQVELASNEGATCAGMTQADAKEACGASCSHGDAACDKSCAAAMAATAGTDQSCPGAMAAAEGGKSCPGAMAAVEGGCPYEKMCAKDKARATAGGEQTVMMDPVCGMSVSEGSENVIKHDGVAYGFCSGECRDAFMAEPGKYIQ